MSKDAICIISSTGNCFLSLLFSMMNHYPLTGGDRNPETATWSQGHHYQNRGETENGQNHRRAGSQVDRCSKVLHKTYESCITVDKMELKTERDISVHSALNWINCDCTQCLVFREFTRQIESKIGAVCPASKPVTNPLIQACIWIKIC